MLSSMILLLLGSAFIEALDPAYAVNITVYHVNQASFGAVPLNMNTGDNAGDMYFDLRSVDIAMECANPTPETAHDCDNAEVVAPNLAITKLVLTVDSSKYGDYGRCNVCVNGSDHHGHNNCTDGEYLCSCGDFNKPSDCGPLVGKQNNTARYATRDCSDTSPPWDCWKSNVAKKIGGFWYSTTKEGWCGSGSSGATGDSNCTWRVAEAVKRVNKTCSDKTIYSSVEKQDKVGCFSQCSGVGPARNTSDPCWITCFYNTALGPEASKPKAPPGGIPVQQLLDAWDLPFASEDKGGCASLPIPNIGEHAFW